MRPKDALRKVVETISRKENAIAVLVPRKIAILIADEMYISFDNEDDVLFLSTERAKRRYISLVEKGGYIGTVMSVPMVVADDVVICSVDEQELRASASRLGVGVSDIAQLKRDGVRAGAA